MKIADRPPYFIDPPVLTAAEEEEYRTYGYVTPDIPGPGKEPLRAGDIIQFITYPTSDRRIAQIKEINSFEQHMEENCPVLRLLNESYPIQLDDSIVRLYTMNYQTGEIEDNKKWAHFHHLKSFLLVQSVVCTKTGKEIKWNRRGKQAELQRETVDDMVSRLHARGDDDLTRAFLTVQPNKQKVTHDEDKDVAIYADVLDICFKQYFECERSETIEEVVVYADNVDECSEPKRINDLVSVASTSSPNRPSSPSSDDKSDQSNNSNSKYNESTVENTEEFMEQPKRINDHSCGSVNSSSESEIDAPELPSVDDCSSFSNKSSSESSSSDGSSSDNSNSCVGKNDVRRTKSASGAASPYNLTKND